MTNRVRATDGAWTLDANGTWSTTANWLGGNVADGTDALADFSTIAITGNRTITLDGSHNIGTIKVSDTDTTAVNGTPNTFTISGANTITLATSSGTPTVTVGVGASNIKGQILTVNSTIAGTQGFIKNGLGDLRIGAQNAGLSGAITVNAGTLRLESGAAANGLGSTTVQVNNGGTLYLNNAAVTVNNNITVNGIGVLETDGINNFGAIRFAAANSTINGTITLGSDSRIGSRGTGTTGGNLNGQITGNFSLELGHVASSGQINLANTANNWGGDTKILSGTVKLINSEVIPDGVAAGNVYIGDANDAVVAAILDLAGKNETINGLNSVGTLSLDFVHNSAATTASTLTVGNNNASGSFGGTLRNNGGAGGTLAFTKMGSGTQTLSGANTYTGATAVNGGTLLINGSLAATAVTVNSGGTLGGSGSIGGNISLLAGGHLSPGAAASVGTLTLSGSANLDISSGVATIGSHVLSYDIGASGVSDKIVLTSGTLTIGSGVLEFDDFSFTDAGITSGDYTLFDTSTAISGSLGSSLSGSIGSFTGTLSLGDGGNDILLHIDSVPEPGSLALFGMSALAFLGLRRAKKIR